MHLPLENVSYEMPTKNRRYGVGKGILQQQTNHTDSLANAASSRNDK